MKIARIEALQLHWDPKDPPTAGSAFLRVWTDEGLCGLGDRLCENPAKLGHVHQSCLLFTASSL
jgi:hypothetical protein